MDVRNMIKTILDDTRKIESISYPDEDASGFWINASKLSSSRCDEIRAYAENGQCAPVPFFAVYRDGQIYARIPAHMVEVRYA
jgi:hypothetical protein